MTNLLNRSFFFCDVSTSEIKTKYLSKAIFLLIFNHEWIVMLKYDMMELCDPIIICFIGVYYCREVMKQELETANAIVSTVTKQK